MKTKNILILLLAIFMAMPGYAIETGTANQVLRYPNSAPAGTRPTYGQLNLSSSAARTGTLPETNGGTNQATYTTGDTLYASASNTLSKLAVGSNGQVSTLASGIPSWAWPEMRNELINGGFDLWQRGTSTTITATGGGTPTATYKYLADQWYVNNVLGGGTVEGIITYSQINGAVAGSRYGAKVQITTAPTGTGIQNGTELYQVLENIDSMKFYNTNGSFAVKVLAFGNVNQVGCQFFYGTTEVKPTNAIGSEQTVSVNTSTYSTCSINGQAMGTSMTTSGTVGVRIRITGVSSGNTYDLNNGFAVEQAVMAVGTGIPVFTRNGQTLGQLRNAAERFYQVLGGTTNGEPVGMGYVSGVATVVFCDMPMRTQMRVSPTVTISANNGLSFGNATNSYQASAHSFTGYKGHVADSMTVAATVAGANTAGSCAVNSNGATINLESGI